MYPCMIYVYSFCGEVMEAGFPAHSEDWFYTLFLFGKAKGAGSVMYSLSKVPSQAFKALI